MFDFVRQHKRIMQLLLVILIFPSFVLFGIDGYKRFTSDSEVVAVVDGYDISLAEVEKIAQQEAARITRQNPGIDLKVFDTQAFKSQVLDQLINDRVLQSAAAKFNIHVTDQRLALAIQTNPQLQAVRDPQGNVQKEIYAALLSAQGMTPEMYESRLRSSLMSESLIQSISATYLSEATRASQSAWSQSRQIAWTRIDPLKLAPSIQINDTDLKAYYDKNAAKFQAQETIQGEWVSLDVTQIARQIEVKPEESRSYYQQNVQSYSTPEQRRARHVLINAPREGTSVADLDKARLKAEELRVRILAKPSTFESVAKSESQDSGSAKQGGDLGFFGKKDMVKPFADAAFDLKVGEVSAVVQSEFGFHIIQVTEIKPGQVQTFESVKPAIDKLLREQMAQKRFAELAEQFTNLVYEQPDGLAPIAKQLGLELKTFPVVTREQLGTLPTTLQHPKVIEALFSADSLAQKRNTAAIDAGSSTLVSARVLQHQTKRQLEFDEAKELVIAQYKSEEAIRKAQTEAQGLKGNGSASLKDEALVSRVKTRGLSAPVINAVLRHPASRLPSRFIVDEGQAGVFVVELRSVMDSPETNTLQLSKNLMQRAYSDAQAQAYLQSLRQQLNVKLKGVDAFKSSSPRG
jgi:peptidyl-prolyl cis-trans isomerase D